MSAPPAPNLVAAAADVAALAREHAAEGEAAGQIAPPVVEAIRSAGLFSMLVPREIGGAEADVATMVRAIEAVSQGDGAAGWCVMIAATTGTTAASLPREGAAEIFGDPRSAAGGVLMPPQKALRTEGGYTATGRWGFGSGSGHASWMVGGFAVHGPDGPEFVADGVPALRMLFFPRADVTVHDTWHVSGLRGTGSNDFEVRDLFVPEHRTCAMLGSKRWAEGPLYTFPIWGLLALGVASVALGLGRAAIEELRTLATAKTPTGSRRLLADRASAQSGLAEAEALVRSSRSFMLESIDDVWARVSAGSKMTLDDRALLRLSATNAAMSCARAVDICYNLGGASSIYEKSALQRHFRDVHTLTQHVMVGQPTLEVAGRIFLGQPTDTAMF